MNGALDQYQVTCTQCKTSSVSVYGTSALLEVYGDMDVEVSVRACTQAAIRACGNHVGPHKFHTPISSKLTGKLETLSLLFFSFPFLFAINLKKKVLYNYCSLIICNI